MNSHSFEGEFVNRLIAEWEREFVQADNDSNRHRVRFERIVQDRFNVDCKYGSRVFDAFVSTISDDMRNIEPYGLSRECSFSPRAGTII